MEKVKTQVQTCLILKVFLTRNLKDKIKNRVSVQNFAVLANLSTEVK